MKLYISSSVSSSAAGYAGKDQLQHCKPHALTAELCQSKYDAIIYRFKLFSE